MDFGATRGFDQSFTDVYIEVSFLKGNSRILKYKFPLSRWRKAVTYIALPPEFTDSVSLEDLHLEVEDNVIIKN